MLFLVVFARWAFAAGVDHAADANAVADLVLADLGANAVTRPMISWPGTIG